MGFEPERERWFSLRFKELSDSLLGQINAAQLLIARYEGGNRMDAVSMGSSKVRNELNLIDRDVGEIAE